MKGRGRSNLAEGFLWIEYGLVCLADGLLHIFDGLLYSFQTFVNGGQIKDKDQDVK